MGCDINNLNTCESQRVSASVVTIHVCLAASTPQVIAAFFPSEDDEIILKGNFSFESFIRENYGHHYDHPQKCIQVIQQDNQIDICRLIKMGDFYLHFEME